jgi:hypothetical protein
MVVIACRRAYGAVRGRRLINVRRFGPISEEGGDDVYTSS